MPVCPSPLCPLPTQDRTFPTVDALVDHAKETRALHALCSVCFRIFKDPEALAQHVEAKHVVTCESCNRKFKSQAALDQHYRASTAHPSCPVCDIGVANNVVLAEHLANAHPRVRCCSVSMYEAELADHFLISRNHPKCPDCSSGFAGRRELADHNAAVHPELQCGVCEKHFASAHELQAHKKEPSSHRKCEFCSAAFKDTAALVEHFTATHLVQEFKDPVMRVAKAVASVAVRESKPSATLTSRPQSRTTVVATTTLTDRKPSVFSDVYSTMHTCEFCGLGFDDTSTLVQHFNAKHVEEELATRKGSISQHEATALATPASAAPSSRSVYQSQQAEDTNPDIRRPPPSNSDEADITYRRYSRQPSISDETDITYVYSSPGSSPSSIGTFTPSPRTSDPDTVPTFNRAALYSPLRDPDTAPTPNRAVLFSPSRASEAISRAFGGEQTPSPRVRSGYPVTPPIITTPAPQTPVTPNTSLHPSSSRSKVSVAETPSGDLSNFDLLKGSPLMSVVDLATPTPSPRTPSVSPAAARLARRTKAAMAALSPFHCRICRSDPCDGITATACGHVFCNGCIVQEVRQNARCPVCNAAVLLFALLKLDV